MGTGLERMKTMKKFLLGHGATIEELPSRCKEEGHYKAYKIKISEN